ncbi:gamma-butyrobetaine dioxygenase [Pseudonocardia hierapolitana]|uniref:Gamma-butyrobetaine dioxygenase n=1 Tax=Pseudonocardia hierapolitana TaxID=1128676 RepID=A0A561SS32_9PSEU|nr:TauD/TfdA family dioxygenase [Pseudonocardia hierapolitana]TWF77684.1 gamma-butyrobetaine dioxygenase [Pseudonocardia hierapolitana]
MATTEASGRRLGDVRPDLKDALGAAGVVPARVDVRECRAVFERDGVVIVPNTPTDPDELVVAAGRTLGGRLRALTGIRPQGGTDSPALGLHSDGANVVVEVHGRRVPLREPDEDYLYMLCSSPAQSGGDSVLIDGYALVDRLAEAAPELHAFLARCDVDYFGGWRTPARGVPATPLVRRLVEWTRGGRRVVRASDYAAPVPREPRWDEHMAFLDEYADVLATAFDCAPRFRLEAGDLMALDNYRILHGRDAFRGTRELHVLAVRSADAW